MKREGKVAKGSGRITTVRSLGYFELSHDPKWTINSSHKLNTRQGMLICCFASYVDGRISAVSGDFTGRKKKFSTQCPVTLTWHPRIWHLELGPGSPRIDIKKTKQGDMFKNRVRAKPTVFREGHVE